jgi:hypothetical protein
MIWWFLILGVSTLVVVCVAIAIYLHLRRNLQKSHTAQEGNLAEGQSEREHPKRG